MQDRRRIVMVEDTICLTFIELAGFTKSLADCETIVDKWCYSFKNMSRLDRLPEDLQLDIFQRLFMAAEIAQFTPEKRKQYDKDMITEQDWENILHTAECKAEERGKVHIARNLYNKGFAMEDIVELTGLSLDQLQRSLLD